MRLITPFDFARESAKGVELLKKYPANWLVFVVAFFVGWISLWLLYSIGSASRLGGFETAAANPWITLGTVVFAAVVALVGLRDITTRIIRRLKRNQRQG